MTSLASLIDVRIAGLPRGLAIQWPGGHAGARAPSVLLRLRHRSLLACLARGRIGDLADAYVRGDMEIDGEMPDVMAIAGVLAGDPVAIGRRFAPSRWLAKLRSRWQHGRERDERQVQFHYDVCDQFFGLWLDSSRVYSCAYFDTPAGELGQAQAAKLDLVCRKLQLRPGLRFLDVGAGWGALLIWAARHYGVHGVGVTLSHNQHDYANRMIADAGLSGRIEVRLQDYRDLQAAGEFDRIASVGMFEHVGRGRMDGYFHALHGLLRPGGLLLNHAISSGGLDNAQLGAGMGDFIEKHIFPGGELMHVTQAAEGLARVGFELLDAENLRPHYARTLWIWSANLERELERARGYTSESTVRAYRLYLAGSAMCFERGWLSVYQLLASKPDHPGAVAAGWSARSDYPFTRRYLAQRQTAP